MSGNNGIVISFLAFLITIMHNVGTCGYKENVNRTVHQLFYYNNTAISLHSILLNQKLFCAMYEVWNKPLNFEI